MQLFSDMQVGIIKAHYVGDMDRPRTFFLLKSAISCDKKHHELFKNDKSMHVSLIREFYPIMYCNWSIFFALNSMAVFFFFLRDRSGTSVVSTS